MVELTFTVPETFHNLFDLSLFGVPTLIVVWFLNFDFAESVVQYSLIILIFEK